VGVASIEQLEVIALGVPGNFTRDWWNIHHLLVDFQPVFFGLLSSNGASEPRMIQGDPHIHVLSGQPLTGGSEHL
jgi:hypothetical protein